jgi:uncharacterized protein YeaO (DUF488 family)
VLVDRLWPRGMTRDQLKLDAWLRDIAPSDELRRWFGHDPDRWPEFGKRYRQELREGRQRELLDDLVGRAAGGTVTLVYGARDEQHNNAAVIREVIELGGLRRRRRLSRGDRKPAAGARPERAVLLLSRVALG